MCLLTLLEDSPLVIPGVHLVLSVDPPVASSFVLSTL